MESYIRDSIIFLYTSGAFDFQLEQMVFACVILITFTLSSIKLISPSIPRSTTSFLVVQPFVISRQLTLVTKTIPVLQHSLLYPGGLGIDSNEKSNASQPFKGVVIACRPSI